MSCGSGNVKPCGEGVTIDFSPEDSDGVSLNSGCTCVSFSRP